MSPILGIWASQNYSRYSLPTSFESIATTTVGAGGTSSVTFSSIPSTYTHLQIRMMPLNSSGGAVDVTAQVGNGSVDTGTNYNWHYLAGFGSSAGAGAFTSTSNISVGNSFTSSGGSVVDILDYANTNKNKTVRTLTGYDSNSAGQITFYSGLWRSTSAINIITLTPGSGNFSQYSHFALYGIKGE